MSQSARFVFQLSASRVEDLRLARIRETTRRYCDRYRALYEQMIREGCDEYLPAEFDHVRRGLAAIEAALPADPEAARHSSMALGTYLTGLRGLARAAGREAEARERERRREAQEAERGARTELERFLHEQLASFADPVARDFACDELLSLQQEYAGRAVEPGLVEAEKENLAGRLRHIRTKAEAAAAAWKAERARHMDQESQRMLLEIHREQLVRDAAENPDAVRRVLEKLDAFRAGLCTAGGPPVEQTGHMVSSLLREADEAVLDERRRRETLKAVIASLRRVGFVVDRPRRQRDGDRDEVVVKARKPAGNRVQFRVAIDGGALYSFDNYEGMGCKADIDTVLPLLQRIYGVTLSGERVLWQNPDRLSRSSRPIDAGTKEHAHDA